VPLDTTNTRLVQFYIRIGSKSLGPTCTRPRSRNEGVVVQFSTNNGVQWQVLRELDFSSLLEPQVVTIELPPPAKTPYTVFRWWQPQVFSSFFILAGKHSAQWALDDVLVGMNDSSRTGFHDKFDGTTPLRHNWYRIQGGEVTSTSFSHGVPERSHSVLLQYSVNGGISWLLLDEFYFPSSTDCLFLHLPLPTSAQTNATRFRLWQPYNSGDCTHYFLFLISPKLCLYFYLFFYILLSHMIYSHKFKNLR
uniref:Reelin n=1 Tax=Oryzias latipes TaxID=8090 RepID=A0A3P9HC08_ORYLA